MNEDGQVNKKYKLNLNIKIEFCYILQCCLYFEGISQSKPNGEAS